MAYAEDQIQNGLLILFKKVSNTVDTIPMNVEKTML